MAFTFRSVVIPDHILCELLEERRRNGVVSFGPNSPCFSIIDVNLDPSQMKSWCVKQKLKFILFLTDSKIHIWIFIVRRGRSANFQNCLNPNKPLIWSKLDLLCTGPVQISRKTVFPSTNLAQMDEVNPPSASSFTDLEPIVLRQPDLTTEVKDLAAF